MTKFSGYSDFSRARIDCSLPVLGKGLPMLTNYPYGAFGSVQYARLFMGTPDEPAWAPERRPHPHQRPLGTLLIFPIAGDIGCVIAGRRMRVQKGDLIVMPPGEYSPIACLDSPTTYGVIETESREGAPCRRQRFAASGLDLARPALRRRTPLTSHLLWRAQASGVNSALHRIFPPGTQAPPQQITGFTLILCLQGSLEVAIRKEGRKATRTIRAGCRAAVSNEFRIGVRNLWQEPASAIQFAFKSPAR